MVKGGPQRGPPFHSWFMEFPCPGLFTSATKSARQHHTEDWTSQEDRHDQNSRQRIVGEEFTEAGLVAGRGTEEDHEVQGGHDRDQGPGNATDQHVDQPP